MAAVLQNTIIRPYLQLKQNSLITGELRLGVHGWLECHLTQKGERCYFTCKAIPPTTYHGDGFCCNTPTRCSQAPRPETGAEIHSSLQASACSTAPAHIHQGQSEMVLLLSCGHVQRTDMLSIAEEAFWKCQLTKNMWNVAQSDSFSYLVRTNYHRKCKTEEGM